MCGNRFYKGNVDAKVRKNGTNTEGRKKGRWKGERGERNKRTEGRRKERTKKERRKEEIL